MERNNRNFQIYQNMKSGEIKSFILKDVSYNSMKLYIDCISKMPTVDFVEVCEVD